MILQVSRRSSKVEYRAYGWELVCSEISLEASLPEAEFYCILLLIHMLSIWPWEYLLYVGSGQHASQFRLLLRNETHEWYCTRTDSFQKVFFCLSCYVAKSVLPFLWNRNHLSLCWPTLAKPKPQDQNSLKVNQN